MRHGQKQRTLSRPRRQRTALVRGLAVSLIRDGRIQTTEAKAKELRPFIEKLVTTAKADSVSNRRLVASTLGEPPAETLTRLFSEIAPAHAERPGGYTRIIKMGRLPSGRDQAVIEFVS